MCVLLEFPDGNADFNLEFQSVAFLILSKRHLADITINFCYRNSYLFIFIHYCLHLIILVEFHLFACDLLAFLQLLSELVELLHWLANNDIVIMGRSHFVLSLFFRIPSLLRLLWFMLRVAGFECMHIWVYYMIWFDFFVVTGKQAATLAFPGAFVVITKSAMQL